MQKITTYSKQIDQQTVKIDAKGKVLGRLATDIANKLRGKNKPNFAPHQIVGDKVIVKNAKLIVVTGRKTENKRYFRHSGYLGGIKEELYKDLIERRPTEIIRRAVKGMLPKNRLQAQLLKNLTIYALESDGEK